jgi:hypothetical protein
VWWKGTTFGFFLTCGRERCDLFGLLGFSYSEREKRLRVCSLEKEKVDRKMVCKSRFVRKSEKAESFRGEGESFDFYVFEAKRSRWKGLVVSSKVF